jgi:hypothetical protein
LVVRTSPLGFCKESSRILDSEQGQRPTLLRDAMHLANLDLYRSAPGRLLTDPHEVSDGRGYHLGFRSACTQDMQGTREKFGRGCNTNTHLAYLPDSLIAFFNLSFYCWDALRLARIMNLSLVWRLGKGPTIVQRPNHALVSWFGAKCRSI